MHILGSFSVIINEQGHGTISPTQGLCEDDCLIFLKNSTNDAQILSNILEAYLAASGQGINFEKSFLAFSSRAGQAISNQVTSILRVPIYPFQGKYLGHPAILGRREKEAFRHLKDKVWNLLNKWNERHFFVGGKEVHIKAVAQALPVYAM